MPPAILHRWANSGVCEKNWIEVKFFGGAERKFIYRAKNTKFGEAIGSLITVKILCKRRWKYLLIVFNRLPEYYLPQREYLKLLLESGKDIIKVDFSKEPKTIVNSIGDENLRSLVEEKKEVEFDLQKYSIEPIAVKGLLIPSEFEPSKRSRKGFPVGEPSYYFYLIRLMEFVKL